MSGERDDSLETSDTHAAAATSATCDGEAATLQPQGRSANDHDQLLPVDPASYAERTELTRGGMGRIVTARDRRLRRTVAIKELRADSPALRARFEREALLTARLQHPSIVSVYEAGRWPSGEPFYAMELVRGRSLDQVIELAGTLRARLALLPHVIAIADALGYAHSERVIHRDLKPHNVMVGDFGETVVIDWGLGKDLARPGDDNESGGLAEAQDVAATAAGEVMGTPAYMPPEQALGQQTDERADVYAIGAILYHLLAGAPPYDGRTGIDVLEAVRCGPRKRLADRQSGVPRDLLAIVDRAMARDRAARYATARELAEDLRRFQAGQLVAAHEYSLGQLVARWVRRHRVAVAVATISVGLIAALTTVSIRRIVREEARANHEREIAERHRSEADASRAEAEELVDFMIFDLKAKLQPLGQLPLLKAVADRTQAYFDRRPQTNSIENVSKRAAALVNVGDVHAGHGDGTAALSAYRSALAIRKTLAAQHPEDHNILLSVADSHQRLGDLFLARGEGPDALASFLAANAIFVELAARSPDDAALKRAHATTEGRIGDAWFYLHADAAAALPRYRVTVEILVALVRRDPAKIDWQRELSVVHDRIGEVLVKQGDTRSALESFRAALEIRERLAAQAPGDVTRQQDLSISYFRLGRAWMATREHASALDAFRKDLAIARKLAATDPSNAEWSRNVAVSHSAVAEVHLATGDLAHALAEFRSARDILTELSAHDPHNAAWKRDLAEIEQSIATCCAPRSRAAR